MTKTLTTEVLNEMVDGNWPESGSSDVMKAMARELLANREAQPVAIVESSAYVTAAQLIGDEPPMKAVKELYEGALVIGQHLYTAPPTPSVSNELLEAIEEVIRISDRDHEAWNRAKAAITACRAAMLAQPVSQGYKLNSPEIPDGCQWTYDEQDYKWDSACGEAWMFSDGDPIENGVKFCQSCGKPVLLAAAPEGGNDA